MCTMADRLRQLIQESSKTLRNIAAETGLSIATLSAWQTGKKIPQVDSVLPLCRYFNCSADYLLGLSNVRQIDQTAEELATENKELAAEVERLQTLFYKAYREAIGNA